MKVLIFVLGLFCSLKIVSGVEPGRYSSSAIRDGSGRNVGRVVTRSNSAAKYQDYYYNGKKTASVRSPITARPSSMPARRK
jgi:hypothetical protein